VESKEKTVQRCAEHTIESESSEGIGRN